MNKNINLNNNIHYISTASYISVLPYPTSYFALEFSILVFLAIVEGLRIINGWKANLTENTTYMGLSIILFIPGILGIIYFLLWQVVYKYSQYNFYKGSKKNLKNVLLILWYYYFRHIFYGSKWCFAVFSLRFKGFNSSSLWFAWFPSMVEPFEMFNVMTFNIWNVKSVPYLNLIFAY